MGLQDTLFMYIIHKPPYLPNNEEFSIDGEGAEGYLKWSFPFMSSLGDTRALAGVHKHRNRVSSYFHRSFEIWDCLWNLWNNNKNNENKMLAPQWNPQGEGAGWCGGMKGRIQDSSCPFVPPLPTRASPPEYCWLKVSSLIALGVHILMKPNVTQRRMHLRENNSYKGQGPFFKKIKKIENLFATMTVATVYVIINQNKYWLFLKTLIFSL